ncbi:MAG: InlB B-repeat-containing protein [Spirochaetaceae bacterium]|nr:InlB B-repeat-containing protein [Spirochaetaceae bacterium]
MKSRISLTNKKNLIAVFLISILILLQTSCGGGGGGGGGAATGDPGASAGSSTGTGTSSQISQSEDPLIPVAARSSDTSVSFKFTQAENSQALAEIYPNDLHGSIDPNSDPASPTIIVPYPQSALSAEPQLKPTVTVANGASINETLDYANYFDDANPVQFTVTAENGTSTTTYTVDMQPMNETTHTITYLPGLDISGSFIHNPNPSTYSEETAFNLDSTTGSITFKNYAFEGWYEDEDCQTPVTGWTAGAKTDNVTLYAKLSSAPYVADNRIYANGHNLDVESNTSIFYYDTNNNRISLSTVDSNYSDFTNYEIFAGKANDNDSSNIGYYVGSSTIKISGGTFKNVFGSNDDNQKAPLAGGSHIYVKGNPVIGNNDNSGIWLATFTDKKALINGSLTSVQPITLVAAGATYDGLAVAKADNSNYTSHEKFQLLTSSCSHSLAVRTNENDSTEVVVEGNIALPSNSKIIRHGDYFTLGDDHINSNGTIFSVYLGTNGAPDNTTSGWFTIPDTQLQNAVLDMAIPADTGANVYLEAGSVSTSTHLKYVQFKSQNGDLSAQAASEFLAGIKFYVQSGSEITVNVNMQTVPWDVIDGDGGYTYFNGSFYKAYPALNGNSNISWTTAYNEAKKKSFNGLKGYLMTITSATENYFIYDRVFGNENGTAWLGATRDTNKLAGGFDADKWEHSSSGKCNDDTWRWVCGPESGREFYKINWNSAGSKATGVGTKLNNMYSNWFDGTWNNTHYIEPNADSSGSEKCAQYCGRTEDGQNLFKYKWNDLTNSGSSNYSQWIVNWYVVEFTPYGNQVPANRVLKADHAYTLN